MPLDLAFGRMLACCVHPSAAWRKLPFKGRVLLVSAYFGASYVTGLLTLLLI
jgi:hypothetical protein